MTNDHDQYPPRHKGVVKMWKGDKGFGFIVPDDAAANNGSDVFAHISNCGGAALAQGERVTFEIGYDKRSGKTAALNVTASA